MYVIHVCLSVCLSVCVCLSHTTHHTPLVSFTLSSSIFRSSFFISLYFSLLISSTCGVIRSFYFFVFFALFGTRLSCFSSLGRQLFGPLPTRWWNEDSASLAEKLQEQLVKFADQSSLYIYTYIYIIDFYKT